MVTTLFKCYFFINVIFNNGNLVDLNIKISNGMYSHTKMLSDRLEVDWSRVNKLSFDQLDDLKVNLFESIINMINNNGLTFFSNYKKSSDIVNEIGKNYYQLVSNFDSVIFQIKNLPDVNVDYCVEYLKRE